jgi:LCP family protein required for cell wall assembly
LLAPRSTAAARGRHVADRSRRTHPVARALATVAACVLVVALAAAAVVYVRLDGNITGVDLTSIGNRPQSSATRDAATDLPPLNILLMGSDTRTELENADEFGGESDLTGADHSDTTLLVHLAADRESAFVISIPRDSMVKRPDCDDPSDTGDASDLGIFNTAFNEGAQSGGVAGGALCTVRTVEANTGVYVDHFAVVNFEGFRDMVDALGGVDICVPEPIDDPATGLRLPAGTSHLDGTEATQFVRARKGIGNGSDIGRIDRQQAFLSAVVREATSSGLLLRPDRLLGFLDAATASLTTDEEIASPRALSELALQARSLPPEQIRFVTVPTVPYEPDPNRVIWTDEAEALWQAAREDLPLPGTEPAEPTASPSASSSAPTTSAPPALTARPDQLSVRVVNSSGVEGLARQAGDALAVQGFAISGLANGEEDVEGVLVRHAPDDEAAAATLAAAFPGATLRADTSLSAGDYVVDLGVGAPAVVEVPNRLGTEPLPEQPLGAGATPGGGAGASPTIDARVAADESCG